MYRCCLVVQSMVIYDEPFSRKRKSDFRKDASNTKCHEGAGTDTHSRGTTSQDPLIIPNNYGLPLVHLRRDEIRFPWQLLTRLGSIGWPLQHHFLSKSLSA